MKLQLVFDEVGCDWQIIADIQMPETAFDEEFLFGMRGLVSELNAGLDALAGGHPSRVGVILMEE